MPQRGPLGTHAEQVLAAGTANHRDAIARAAEQASGILECCWGYPDAPLRGCMATPLVAACHPRRGEIEYVK